MSRRAKTRVEPHSANDPGWTASAPSSDWGSLAPTSFWDTAPSKPQKVAPPPPEQKSEPASTNAEQKNPQIPAITHDQLCRKMRNLKKTLREIDDLLERKKAGEVLIPEQLTKLQRREQLLKDCSVLALEIEKAQPPPVSAPEIPADIDADQHSRHETVIRNEHNIHDCPPDSNVARFSNAVEVAVVEPESTPPACSETHSGEVPTSQQPSPSEAARGTAGPVTFGEVAAPVKPEERCDPPAESAKAPAAVSAPAPAPTKATAPTAQATPPASAKAQSKPASSDAAAAATPSRTPASAPPGPAQGQVRAKRGRGKGDGDSGREMDGGKMREGNESGKRMAGKGGKRREGKESGKKQGGKKGAGKRGRERREKRQGETFFGVCVRACVRARIPPCLHLHLRLFPSSLLFLAPLSFLGLSYSSVSSSLPEPPTLLSSLSIVSLVPLYHVSRSSLLFFSLLPTVSLAPLSFLSFLSTVSLAPLYRFSRSCLPFLSLLSTISLAPLYHFSRSSLSRLSLLSTVSLDPLYRFSRPSVSVSPAPPPIFALKQPPCLPACRPVAFPPYC